MITIASLFSGIGGVEFGASAADIKTLWGIEKDSNISKYFQLNHDTTLYNSDISQVQISALEQPDILWASPPCQHHSAANTRANPESKQGTVGEYCLNYVATLLPKVFIVENVPPYLKSKSYGRLKEGLKELGYIVESTVLECFLYGVPQFRKRAIVIATKCKQPISVYNIPHTPVHSWYYGFLDWFLDALLIDSKFDLETQPLTWYTPKVFGEIRSYSVNKLCPTMLASYKKHRITDENNRARIITPKAAAILQTFPNDVILPSSLRLSQKMVGNAVPPKFAEAILSYVKDRL